MKQRPGYWQKEFQKHMESKKVKEPIAAKSDFEIMTASPATLCNSSDLI